jgi:4-hydroxy-3-polyprenylbenzoate decarboxylase
MPAATPRRLIVAITGASGAAYGVRLLDRVRAAGGIETHLLISGAGMMNIAQELELTRAEVEARADVVHRVAEVGAAIASGSFQCLGMVIAPCSIRTLAAVAHGLSDNLITRAADVTLKERRRLVLMVRETPLNLAHIRAMEAVTLMGGIVFPPVPALYHRPESIEAMIDHSVDRVLDLMGIDAGPASRWAGMRGEG